MKMPKSASFAAVRKDAQYAREVAIGQTSPTVSGTIRLGISPFDAQIVTFARHVKPGKMRSLFIKMPNNVSIAAM